MLPEGLFLGWASGSFMRKSQATGGRNGRNGHVRTQHRGWQRTEPCRKGRRKEIKVQGGAERSKHNKINHFLNDNSIMGGQGKWDTVLLMSSGLSLAFKAIHILLLYLLAVTPSLISVPDITGKTIF